MFPPSLPTYSKFSHSIGRRDALKGSLALTGCALLSTQVSPALAAEPATQPAPKGTTVPAILEVSLSTIGSIGPEFIGLSYEKSALSDHGQLFRSTNQDLISLYRLLGRGVLRIGGNAVDETVWASKGAGSTRGEIAPADVDALADFLAATGWQCLYAVNLGGAGPHPFAAAGKTAAITPELAAEEVAYVSSKLGSSLLGIEIGNECDAYGVTYFKGATWDLPTFEALWSRFRDAIVARSPGVQITGPADASNVSTWTVPFGEWAKRQKISLLTQHFYRGDGRAPNLTAEKLLSPDTRLTGMLAQLNTAAKAIEVPYRMAECNSYFDGGAPGLSNSYSSALWVLDFLFDCALGGASGVNLHGGGRFPGYTPIADSGGYVVEARPEFYGLLLFALAGPGTLLATQLSSGSMNATAYSVKTAADGLNLVIVNKDAARNLSVTAHLPRTVRTASLMELSQSPAAATQQDASPLRGVAIQGSGIGSNGSFAPGAAYSVAVHGSQVSCFVPAMGAVLVRVS